MLQSSANKLRKVDRGEDGMPLVETRTDGQGSKLTRGASCLENPQASALDCVLDGSEDALRLLSDILSKYGGSLEVNKEYPQQSFKSLLQLSVERGDLATSNILLRAGADPGRVNKVLKTTPIHAAAGLGNKDLLSLFVEKGGPGCLNTPDRDGRTPLHLSVLACKQDLDKGMQCVRLCVSKGADVNVKDKKGGQTPVYLAASSNVFKCVQYLLDHGADSSIPCQGMSTRQLIKDSFPEELIQQLDLTGTTASTESSCSRLINLVNQAECDGPDDDVFQAALQAVPLKEIDSCRGEYSLVQLAANKGLDTYLRMLLRKGANPNTTTATRMTSPFNLAARNGFNEVIKVLLEEDKLLVNGTREGVKVIAPRVDVFSLDANGMSVLHNVLRKPFHNLDLREENGMADYSSCLDTLLRAKVDWSKIINKQDSNENTALHYAVQFWDQDTVTKLLLLGANIGLRNKLGESPISSILPQTMEDFLNDHCMIAKGNPTNDEFKITFKYDFLAPPRESLPPELRKPASSKSSTKEDPYLDTAEDEDTSIQPETEVLWYMARSKEHRHLLKHPVITSFLYLKWGRISLHYNSNLLFYTILVACLTCYIFSLYGGTQLGVQFPNCTNNSLDHSGGSSLTGYQLGLWWTLLVLMSLLAVREMFQFSISAARYFYSYENYLEVALLISMGLLLGYGSPGCYVQMKRELSATALLLSWVELVTMVGRHPMLSAYNTYLTMFYRVLKTFLQFLAWYSLFVVAFALSFYILLHNDVTNPKESEFIYFDGIGLAIVKTFSMFIGELEFSDLPLSSSFSYVFFLTYVFLIVVVLMNLLNGLAVSDTGLIREEAEIHSHVCRVEVISAAEATILGDPAHILTGAGKQTPTCGVRSNLGRICRARLVFQKMFRSSGIMLFYKVLPDKRLEIFPNKRNVVCSPCLSTKDVSKDVLNSSKNLVLKLTKERQGNEGLEAALNNLRRRQTCVEDKLEAILNKLENISNSLGV